MNWPGAIQAGTLIRRYQRFLADIRLDSGDIITAHCPNTGAMTGCATPGSRVWLTESDNPRRKYRYTWQCIDVDHQRICIHSALANTLVAEALDSGSIQELAAYAGYRREVKIPGGSRVDFLLQGGGERADCYLEVKAVTLDGGNGLGVFPDTPSERARRHVHELQALRRQGSEAAMLFAVLHTGIRRVASARHIDPDYASALDAAVAAGLQVLAYRASIDLQGMQLVEVLPLDGLG